MLNSISFEGDLTDVNGSFCEDDLRAIHNDKWRAKVERYFSHVPQKIDLVILGQRQDEHFDILRGVVMSGHCDEVQPRAKEGVITVVLGGNRERGAGRRIEEINSHPFTPWIVVHRFVHAIDFCVEQSIPNRRTKRKSEFSSKIKTLTSILPKTVENYGIRTLDGHDFYVDIAVKAIVNDRLRRPEGISENIERMLTDVEASVQILLNNAVGTASYF